jgi:ketose-bisphosphate aldolase
LISAHLNLISRLYKKEPMPLVSIKQELAKARQNHYAVPLYDVFEIEGMEGVIDAMLEKRAPTIIGIYTAWVSRPNNRALAAYVRARVEDLDIPVSLMVDHGASVELCLQALKDGYTDVMYDGSRLTLEENIANTRKVVEAAHAVGAAVEAELGHVGDGHEYQTYGAARVGFTDPAAVEYFVEKTGVDMLAVAFGTAHGFYKGEPHLDLELLGEITRRVDTPLVMHGGTGLSDEQFRGAIAGGVSKINFATNIVNDAGQMMKATAGKPEGGMFEMLDNIRTTYRNWSCKLYDVFGTTGKA